MDPCPCPKNTTHTPPSEFSKFPSASSLRQTRQSHCFSLSTVSNVLPLQTSTSCLAFGVSKGLSPRLPPQTPASSKLSHCIVFDRLSTTSHLLLTAEFLAFDSTGAPLSPQSPSADSPIFFELPHRVTLPVLPLLGEGSRRLSPLYNSCESFRPP